MLSARLPARSISHNLARSLSTASATPNKDHHIVSYKPDAFPTGYFVASTHSGIKKKAGVPDLGILVSSIVERPTSAAACMTRNVFKAAPVTVSTEVLEKGAGRARGFIVNSGCANAVTGKKGLEDAWAMSKAVSDNVAAPEGHPEAGTLVMSTGVIGQHLPIDKITSAVPQLTKNLDNSPEAWMGLARAFMTTDTFPKLRTREFTLAGRTVKMVGIDKGAGMIAPNMGPPQPPHATLLGVIATDAAIAPAALQSALNYAVERSFNSITVDGDMSTNDTVVCLANGAATPDLFELTEDMTTEFTTFKEELASFAAELAQLIVRDGEGATKFVTIKVINAPNYASAHKVGMSVANSALFKTAMYGQDANWGRILCAVGYADLPPHTFDPKKVSVTFTPTEAEADKTPLKLLTNGEPEPNISEERASQLLKYEDINIEIDLGLSGVDGSTSEATVWTCDFSHEYVTINGDYRS